MNSVPSTNDTLIDKVNCNNNPQQIEQTLENIVQNDSYEVYVPEKYGLEHNNTFVMTFCKPSLYDCIKKLFGNNTSYEYEDYIQYKLFKKYNKRQDILIKTIFVEKNAIHCQGLVKKLIVIKDCDQIPKKIIFVRHNKHW